MQDKILSVIIPYYKETAAELFLPLSSVSGQIGVDFDKIECILVNDGHPMELPEGFLSLFEPLSIRCIDLDENRGPGIARQAGIDHANGEYVMFCDADDALQNVWTLRTFLEEIEARRPEIIYASIVMEQYDANTNVYIYGIKDDMIQMMHGKAYRRAYLNEKNIRFHENLRIYEDIYFNVVAFAGASQIQEMDMKAYIRKYRADSLTRADSNSYFIETMPENIKCAGYICDAFEEKYPEKLPDMLVQQVVYFYFIMHWQRWMDAEGTVLLKKAEQIFRDMVAPRFHYFEKASEACVASAYNQNRLKFFIGEMETESLAEWLERVNVCGK